MSLDNVPLTVRLGSSHITQQVAAVGFRKEAVGGVRNIRLRLARPLDRVDQITALSRVYLYDARSAATIAEARLSDLGRGADAGSGQQWDIVAFGPLQHASDITRPLIYIDQDLGRWNLDDYQGVEMARGAISEDGAAFVDGQIHKPTLGQTVATTFHSAAAYRAIYESGQKVGSIITSWRAGVADGDYHVHIFTQVTPSGSVTDAYDAAFATGTTNKTVVVVTDFANGATIARLHMTRETTTTTALTTHWLRWKGLKVRALLLSNDGTEITSGYTTAYVTAAQVVKDLLGRVLDQYDGANAIVAAASYQIDQMAYPDGVTAAQVLDDLMALEPAYYWTTGPSNSAGKYAFEWRAWPTTVRYEVTLNDGGSFPVSTQELYNRVLVRWKSPSGQVRSTYRPSLTGVSDCPVLNNAVPPIVRQAIIDAGDEIASAANADRLGDNFLADHKYPNNAGSLTISRPIRDLKTGAMVRPHEIEPAELIRVRGIESYPDALNASSSDGQTVFRIHSMEYDSDPDSAVLELDTDSRTMTNAIARLIKRRTRRR